MLLAGLANAAPRRGLPPSTHRDSEDRGQLRRVIATRAPVAGKPTRDEVSQNADRSADSRAGHPKAVLLLTEQNGAAGEVGASNGFHLHRSQRWSQLGPESSALVPNGTCLRETVPFGNTDGMSSQADRFKKARDHAGLSQAALAARCEEQGHSVSRGQIAKLEAGERTNPRSSDVQAIARATGVRMPWLMGERGPMVEGHTVEEELGAFDAAVGWFLANESHEGRGDDAKAFLAQRDVRYAGAEGRSPGWWLETLRDEFRAWRVPAKIVGVREIGENEPDTKPAKINARRVR